LTTWVGSEALLPVTFVSPLLLALQPSTNRAEQVLVQRCKQPPRQSQADFDAMHLSRHRERRDRHTPGRQEQGVT
jgi:hypothetical protein